MSPKPPSDQVPPDVAEPATTRADQLVRIGAILFLIGLVATAAAIIPFFFGADNLPTWLNAVAGGGLTLGFAVALVGVLSAVRSKVPEEDDPDLYVNNPYADRAEETDPEQAPGTEPHQV